MFSNRIEFASIYPLDMPSLTRRAEIVERLKATIAKHDDLIAKLEEMIGEVASISALMKPSLRRQVAAMEDPAVAGAGITFRSSKLILQPLATLVVA